MVCSVRLATLIVMNDRPCAAQNKVERQGWDVFEGGERERDKTGGGG